MANQLNFSEPIKNEPDERPIRLTSGDYNLVAKGEQMKLFGTSTRENLECWFYHPDGTFAATVRIPIEDSSIQLSTMVDGTGVFEYINLNLEKISEYSRLAPGRYSMTVYFFRDEVGNRFNKKLYIKKISPSRTELVLTPIVTDTETAKQIFEFVVPSVPRLYAKGLTDQVFGKNIDVVVGESISNDSIKIQLNDSGSIDRVVRSNSQQSLDNLLLDIEERTYENILELLSSGMDLNIQSIEFQNYISSSINTSIAELKSANAIDKRFNLI